MAPDESVLDSNPCLIYRNPLALLSESSCLHLTPSRYMSLTDKSVLDSNPELYIHIIPDKTNRTLSIIDSGEAGCLVLGNFVWTPATSCVYTLSPTRPTASCPSLIRVRLGA